MFKQGKKCLKPRDFGSLVRLGEVRWGAGAGRGELGGSPRVTGSCVQGGTREWPKEGKGDGAGGTRGRRGELEVRGGVERGRRSEKAGAGG